MKKIRLLHLSDIHFQRPGSIGHDPDYALREELRADVEKIVATRGALDAIVVTGDIAFSGSKPQYDEAERWLDALADTGGCGREMVYVCPGNHDVDRDYIVKNSPVKDMHRSIRGEANNEERERQLLIRLGEDTARELIFKPLTEYNEFAARYNCAFFADDRYAWDSEDLILNDGSVLKIRGLNSALLSGPGDNKGSLFLGKRACTITRRPGVEYLTICHHPPSWLMDGAEAELALRNRARIMLFGHEHNQRIDFRRDSVTLYAGAVNPARDEAPWTPGYNMIEVWIETSNDQRQLHVEVVAREWQEDPTQFRNHEDTNNRPTHKHHYELGPWTAPEPAEVLVTPESGSNSESTTNDTEDVIVPPMRRIVNEFFRLSISKKSAIAGSLDLLDDSEKGLPEVQRFTRALERARQRGKLAQLWKMTTDQRH
ncbi:metallophosphoesterase [Burkholderia gladioli]|uniref:metallophosphoesterase n=1 Tax=Burkholderia gladioli TaxID=28095 RepID=UPI0034DB028A